MNYILTSNGELYHYGVKGMKWGVRRYQNKDGSLTPEGKAKVEDKEQRRKAFAKKVAIGAAAVGVTMVVLGGVYLYKKSNMPTHVQTLSFGKEIDLSSLSTKETTIPKGAKLYRMSTKSVEDYAKSGKRIYTSYLKSDARIYKETMPKQFSSWASRGIISGYDNKAYEHILRTKNDIKVPSKRTMAEIYMKVTGNTKVDDGRYKRFMEGLVDGPDADAFFKEVKKRGFNAVIDENDAGILSKMPLIILDPGDNVETSGSHRVRKLEQFINVVLM